MAKNKSTPLSTKDYSTLRKEIARLLERGEERASERRIEAYWKIGERIAALKLATQAGYHNSILKDLSRDTGSSVRNLQRAVTLHSFYEAPPTMEGLTWTQVRVLLQVADPKQREHLTHLAATEKMSAREISAWIEDQESNLSVDSALPRPQEPSFIYRAEVLNVVDGDTLEVRVDLGFEVFSQQRIRLASLNCSAITTQKGRDAKDLVRAELLKAKTTVLKTNKIDIYGRYVAHVFLSPRESSIENCYEKGLYLNNLLLEKKLARKSK